MINKDYWNSFISSGKINDYLHYIACTQEEGTDEPARVLNREKEGGLIAGINYSDGDGFVGHASW